MDLLICPVCGLKLDAVYGQPEIRTRNLHMIRCHTTDDFIRFAPKSFIYYYEEPEPPATRPKKAADAS